MEETALAGGPNFRRVISKNYMCLYLGFKGLTLVGCLLLVAAQLFAEHKSVSFGERNLFSDWLKYKVHFPWLYVKHWPFRRPIGSGINLEPLYSAWESFAGPTALRELSPCLIAENGTEVERAMALVISPVQPPD